MAFGGDHSRHVISSYTAALQAEYCFHDTRHGQLMALPHVFLHKVKRKKITSEEDEYIRYHERVKRAAFHGHGTSALVTDSRGRRPKSDRGCAICDYYDDDEVYLKYNVCRL